MPLVRQFCSPELKTKRVCVVDFGRCHSCKIRFSGDQSVMKTAVSTDCAGWAIDREPLYALRHVYTEQRGPKANVRSSHTPSLKPHGFLSCPRYTFAKRPVYHFARRASSSRLVDVVGGYSQRQRGTGATYKRAQSLKGTESISRMEWTTFLDNTLPVLVRER